MTPLFFMDFHSFFRYCLLPLGIFITLHGPNTVRGEILDRVMAVVNDDVITLSEINEQGETYFENIKKVTPTESYETALEMARKEVLESLIDIALVSQKAKSLKIKVKDTEVDAALNNMISQSGLSREQFLAKLQSSGHSQTTYKKNLKNQILQSKVVNYDIRSRLVITDKEMQDKYNKQYLQEDVSGGLYLLQIGLSWDKLPGETFEQKKNNGRKRAERVWNLAKNGSDFRMLAKKFSDLPSSVDGGDIGVFKKDEMAKFMQDAILELKAGEISNIIETPSGFQFFKLLSTKEGNSVAFETVKEEIREELYQDKLKESFKKWVKKLRENAYINRL